MSYPTWHLPFRPDAFDGAVSLHTLHHLPLDDQFRAYGEIYRVLAPEDAAVVNGWTMRPLCAPRTALCAWLRRWAAGSPPARPAGTQEKARGNAKPQMKAWALHRKLNAGLLRRQRRERCSSRSASGAV